MKTHPLLLLGILTFIVPSLSKAQQNTFNMVYKSAAANGGIQASSIVRDFDNGYLITGTDVSNNNGLIIKTDSLGHSIWCKSYGFMNSFVDFRSAIRTKDSCFLIAGGTNNSTTLNNEVLCVKINLAGDTIWSKTLAKAGLNLYSTSVNQTDDSGYIVCGYTQENDHPDQCFVGRLDKTGNLLWANVMGAGDWGVMAFSTKQTTDKGFLSIGYYSGLSGVSYAILIKLDATGTQSWSKKYQLGSSAYCYGFDFVNANDGYLCYLNTYLMKTDFSGNVIWIKPHSAIPEMVCINCPSPKLRPLSDGGYILIKGEFWFSGRIVKVDSMGNQLWENYLALSAADVTETGNKELVIVGNGPLIGVKSPQINEPQIGIIQTDSLGHGIDCVFSSGTGVVTDTITASSVTFTSINGVNVKNFNQSINSKAINERSACVDNLGEMAENAKAKGINIFPNPAQNTFNIESEGDLKDATMSVYDTKMQLVLQQSLQHKHHEVDISRFSAGMYYVKITPYQTSGVWKLVKE